MYFKLKYQNYFLSLLFFFSDEGDCPFDLCGWEDLECCSSLTPLEIRIKLFNLVKTILTLFITQNSVWVLSFWRCRLLIIFEKTCIKYTSFLLFLYT